MVRNHAREPSGFIIAGLYLIQRQKTVGAPLMLHLTQPMKWIPRRNGGGHQPIKATQPDG